VPTFRFRIRVPRTARSFSSAAVKAINAFTHLCDEPYILAPASNSMAETIRLVVKDNICVEGLKATAGSSFLKGSANLAVVCLLTCCFIDKILWHHTLQM
jgi:hypothetical protein